MDTIKRIEDLKRKKEEIDSKYKNYGSDYHSDLESFHDDSSVNSSYNSGFYNSSNNNNNYGENSTLIHIPNSNIATSNTVTFAKDTIATPPPRRAFTFPMRKTLTRPSLSFLRLDKSPIKKKKKKRRVGIRENNDTDDSDSDGSNIDEKGGIGEHQEQPKLPKKTTLNYLTRLSKALTPKIPTSGLAPQTPLTPGRRYSISQTLFTPSKVTIEIFDYSADRFERRVLNNEDELLSEKPDWANVRWIDIDGVDIHLLRILANKYKIHPICLDDVINSDNQRPRMDKFDNYIFIIASMLTEQKQQLLNAEQMSMFLFHHTLITVQEGYTGDVFQEVRDCLDDGDSGLRKSDVSYLLFTLLEMLSSNCFPLVEHFSEILEDLELKMLGTPTSELNRKAYNLRRELLLLKRHVSPMKEVLNRLCRDVTLKDFITPTARTYLDSNVRADLNHLLEVVETYSEIAVSLSSLYNDQNQKQMNQVIYVLTMVSSIFIPLSFIVGLYGMNFQYLPELHWKYGYVYVWIIIIVVVAAELFIFWKKKWFTIST